MAGSRSLWLGVLAGAVATLVALGLIGLTVVYTGAYDVAATEEHAAFSRWALDTTYHNSVEARAAGMPAPPTFTPALVTAGAVSYKAMCQHCHAGPGVKRAEWAQGMRPQPPHLTEAAAHWSPREVFWLLKHGVKMSGMPAFGPTHGDDALWALVAFVKELPALTPERYAALVGTQEGGGHDHGAGGHDGGHDGGGHGGAASPQPSVGTSAGRQAPGGPVAAPAGQDKAGR